MISSFESGEVVLVKDNFTFRNKLTQQNDFDYKRAPMTRNEMRGLGRKTPLQRGFFLRDFPSSLLGISDLKVEHIRHILTRSAAHRSHFQARFQAHSQDKPSEALRGKTVINLFFEPSTRTRTSFELAARRLSANLITMAPQSSSLSKGESLKDMVENLEAMGPRLLVVRHALSGVPGLIAAHTKAAVINAGDGSHEHPTQALVDLSTVEEKLGGVKGLHLVIVGDIAYSRVARSNIYAFQKMGARVTCVGPATLLPPGLEKLGVKISTRLDEVLPQADVLMLLRIQKERQETMNFPSLAEYTHFFGLTARRFQKMQKGSLIMHPGPINRGVEIDSEVADGLIESRNSAKTVILDQVKNGIPVRMAILELWGGQG